ncbi:unnamed protein product [Microthlaspi erraticum]|uniref:Uncharacterized protein n=1 Tax=Microthlaspi erraticum TaxID=1685480 RepID=A0A6D2HG52_9BRAS|nr:unnamed protein product [Microthlaspi erraticum]
MALTDGNEYSHAWLFGYFLDKESDKKEELVCRLRLRRETAMEVHKESGEKHTSTISDDQMSNIPKDSDLYHTKQKEAKRRFEILVELEKKLASHFSRPRIGNR